MRQNSASRGRPAQFDRQSVIDAVMLLFWERGYEGTSMPELEQRTGLNRSSLYNSFGSKPQLFALALDRYAQRAADEMLRPLEKGNAGLADLLAFLTALRTHIASAGVPDGCLMLNSMIEFGGSDAAIRRQTERYLARMGRAFALTLDRAGARKEIARGHRAERVHALLGLIMGILVAVRARMPRSSVNAMLSAAETLVEAWSLPGGRRRP